MNASAPDRPLIRHVFALTVIALRERVGLSQERLANEAGVSRGYMGRLEREQSTPTIEIVYRLAPHLKVTVEDFFVEFDRILRQETRRRR